jgi:hypothetical protein
VEHLVEQLEVFGVHTSWIWVSAARLSNKKEEGLGIIVLDLIPRLLLLIPSFYYDFNIDFRAFMTYDEVFKRLQKHIDKPGR